MRKLTWTTAVVLSILVVAACGGGKKQKASLTPATTKLANPPAGQAAPSVGAPGPQPCGETIDAAWTDTPQSIRETMQRAKTAVEGQVAAVAPGDDLVVTASQEPGGSYHIPTQRVTLRVTKKYKGTADAGQTLTIFQTGSGCRTLHGDPAYKQGDKELLMLADGPNNTLRPVSPEGRYKEAADGTLQPVVDNQTTGELKGRRLGDVEGTLRDAANLPTITTPTPPGAPPGLNR